MASLFKRVNDRFELQFSFNKKRRTIRLGRLSESAARRFKSNIETLVAYRNTGLPMPPSILAWLNDLRGTYRERLEHIGLIAPVVGHKTMGDLLSLTEDRYADKKQNTRRNILEAADHLMAHFKTSRALRSISARDCEQFRRGLPERFALTTRTEICRKSRTIFNQVVGTWIETNPFSSMKGWTHTNGDRAQYIDIERVRTVYDDASPLWRSVIAMSRIAGMRPCEQLSLRWCDVDFDRRALMVDSPKTGMTRCCPLFEDVFDSLKVLNAKADSSIEFVLARWQGDHLAKSIDSGLRKLFAAKGIRPWPKLFTNARSSAEIDLLDAGYPLPIVAEWLGHSTAIATRHYIRAHEVHFLTATGRENQPKVVKGLKGQARPRYA